MLRSPVRLLAGVAPEGVPGLRQLARAGLGRVFGPPPFDASADPGDPGLLGGDPVSGPLIGEPAAIVGGIRALLVQLLHPHAMAGVADHSRFRADPLGRLHRTSAYVTTTAFASTPQALAAARAVRRVHTFVRGTAPDGRPYRADDPHLLTWVSVALTSSFLATDRAYAPTPVEGAAADAFVEEQSRAGALLDPRVDLDALEADADALAALRAGTLPLPMLDDGSLPRDAAGLADRLEAFRGELGLNHQGREAWAFLRWPPLPATIRAGYLPMLAAALATLEPWQRRLLRLPGGRAAAWPAIAQARALLAGFRLATGVSPSVAVARRRRGIGPSASATGRGRTQALM